MLLRILKIKVSPGEKKGKISAILYFFFALILITWLLEIIKPAFRFEFLLLPELLTKNLIENKILKISGAGIILISLILFTITLVHFKNSLRFGLNEKNTGKLITSGIFSISRNPFFLSLDFYFLGIVLIFPCFFFIVFTLFAFAGIHFFILKEEKFMQKVYGEEYNNYYKKVGRYF